MKTFEGTALVLMRRGQVLVRMHTARELNGFWLMVSSDDRHKG